MEELTEQFTQALFAQFPEWRQYVKTVSASASDAGAVTVEVPQEGSDRKLYMSTEDDEITIGFDAWHTHVGSFLGLDIEQCVVEAMNILDEFVREESVVIVAYRVVQNNAIWTKSSFEEKTAPIPRELGVRTIVYSWRRTYDRVVEPV